MQAKGVASVSRREMGAYTCRDTNRELVLAVHACLMTRQLIELGRIHSCIYGPSRRGLRQAIVNARLQISKKALKLTGCNRISRILQKIRYRSGFHRIRKFIGFSLPVDLAGQICLGSPESTPPVWVLHFERVVLTDQ
jgi:hypothetical protein